MGVDKLIAADQSQTMGDLDISARPQKLFVPPWDAQMAADSITASNRRYKALKACPSIYMPLKAQAGGLTVAMIRSGKLVAAVLLPLLGLAANSQADVLMCSWSAARRCLDIRGFN